MSERGSDEDEAHLVGQWARLLLGTLQAAGVSDLFISPGSRSTPFVWQALKTNGLRCHSIIDERAAAFAALGHARVTGRPAAILCTSGSAAANYFPAVVEASLAFLPLVVLTADRPFEVQHAGAAQTIDQLKLYGDHVRRYFELGLPERSESALVGLRRTVTQAVAQSLGPVPGPVHLNARARKPLEPGPAQSEEQRALDDRVSALLASPPTRYTRAAGAPSPELLDEIAETLISTRAGAIAVGPLPIGERALAAPLARLASRLAMPVMAEAASQVRFALAEHPFACPELDWLLGSEPLRARLAPDLLLYLGSSPTSSAFERWAERSGITRIVLCEHGAPDPLGTARFVLQGDVTRAVSALTERVQALAQPPSPEQLAFAEGVVTRSRSCRALISEELERDPEFAEGSAVRAVARALPKGAELVLGNSLPIRDVDAYVFAANELGVHSQRGANGIDGLIAGAAGTALAAGRPTLLLLGDVSFAHDLSSLAVARLVRTPLALVILDNAGGRIFDQLPIARLYAEDAARADFWRTPHTIVFEHAARAYGVRFAAPPNELELERAVNEALRQDGVTVLHVRVGPESAERVRRRVLARLSANGAEPRV